MALLGAWLFVLYADSICIPNLLQNLVGLVALAVFISLPVGYIICILSQWWYLEGPMWLRWLHIGKQRLHGQAANSAKVTFTYESKEVPPEDEPTLEALTLAHLVLTGLREKLPVNDQRFIQEWIRRRNDVVAINRSVIVATILALIAAALILAIGPQLLGNPPSRSLELAILLAISAVVISIMCCSSNALEIGITVLRLIVLVLIWGSLGGFSLDSAILLAISVVVVIIMWLSKRVLEKQIVTVITEVYRQFRP